MECEGNSSESLEQELLLGVGVLCKCGWWGGSAAIALDKSALQARSCAFCKSVEWEEII